MAWGGVGGGFGPGGASQTLSIAGTVPLQWNSTHRPEYCGVRPVPPDESPHGGRNPLASAATSCS